MGSYYYDEDDMLEDAGEALNNMILNKYPYSYEESVNKNDLYLESVHTYIPKSSIIYSTTGVISFTDKDKLDEFVDMRNSLPTESNYDTVSAYDNTSTYDEIEFTPRKKKKLSFFEKLKSLFSKKDENDIW